MHSLSVTSVQRPKKQQRDSTLPGVAHHHRSSTLTPPGFLFVFVTLFLALGAINGQNNLLFWLFGFSIAALVVSGIITGNALMSIRLAAHDLETTELGSPLKPRYTLHNTSRLLPNFALEVIELDAPGYSKKTPSNSIPAVVLHLRPKTHSNTQSQLTPANRGLLNLSRIRIRSRFPFGLFTKSIDFHIPRQALILPRDIDTDQLNLDQLIASDEYSTRSINRQGTGLDYFGIRQYQPGDPLRAVAWKQSARTDTLLVTEYPEPATEELTLELTAPSEQTTDELFERAISLAYSILKATPTNTRIAFSIPSASIAIPPSSAPAHISRCTRTLALLDRSSLTVPDSKRPTQRRHLLSIGYARSTALHAHDLYAEDFSES